MGDADHSITSSPMDATGKNTTSAYEGPEEWFQKRKEYIRHYYKQEAELRSIRLECLQIAARMLPQGSTHEKTLEFANKYYNWIVENGKTKESKGS